MLISPSVGYEPLPDGPPETSEFLWVLQEFAIWSMGDLLPRLMIKDFDPTDSQQLAYFKGVMNSLIPLSPRFAGRQNDIVQRVDPRIDQWPLDHITVPTLIFHGNADDNSDYQGSVQVAAKIPKAKLVTFEGGDHFIVITHAREIRDHVLRFVSDLAAERGPEYPGPGSEH